MLFINQLFSHKLHLLIILLCSDEFLVSSPSKYSLVLIKTFNEENWAGSNCLVLTFQMQACTLDFENEKLDRQNMQHQLYVILKELRKARSQITQLESLVSSEWLI